MNLLLESNKPWDWKTLSCNPNLTWDIVHANPDKDWDWRGLSYIQRYMDMVDYSDKPWDQMFISKRI